MPFQVGDRVDRIEDREVTGATVISVVEMGDGTNSVELDYDEGPSGWWPENCIKKKDEN
jgi:hypothetical protein